MALTPIATLKVNGIPNKDYVNCNTSVFNYDGLSDYHIDCSSTYARNSDVEELTLFVEEYSYKDFQKIDLEHYLDEISMNTNISVTDYTPLVSFKEDVVKSDSPESLEEIQEIVTKYLEENYPQGSKTIDLGRDYEFPVEQIEQILIARDIDGIQEIIAEEENRIFELNEDSEKSSIKDEVIEYLDNENIDYSEDEDEINDFIDDFIMENGIIGIENVLQGSIRANVYPHNENGERLSFSEFSDLIDINLGEDNYNDDSKNLLKAMEILNVNPHDVGKLLLERGDIVINNFPKREVGWGLDPKKFLEAVKDNGYYGGDLMFTTSMDLHDYVKNFETIKERGVIIPENTQFGFIDNVNGTCAFDGYKAPKDIELKNYDISDDRAIHRPLEKIAGVVPSCFWGASKLNFIKTEQEKELLGKATLLSFDNDLKRTHLNKDKTIAIVSYFVDDLKKALDNEPYTEKLLDPKIIKEKFEKFYWVKDKPEALDNAMKIITNITENFEKKSAKELLNYVDEYRYNLEDFKSPIQKIAQGAKQYSKNLDVYLEEKFRIILDSPKNKDNLEAVINKNFDDFKKQFENPKYTVVLEQDKRFFPVEQETFLDFMHDVESLIETSKQSALSNLKAGTFDAKETVKIITKIADKIKEKDTYLDGLIDAKGFINNIDSEDSHKSKPKKDR